jgi:hypothetical protein
MFRSSRLGALSVLEAKKQLVTVAPKTDDRQNFFGIFLTVVGREQLHCKIILTGQRRMFANETRGALQFLPACRDSSIGQSRGAGCQSKWWGQGEKRVPHQKQESQRKLRLEAITKKK